MDYKKYFWDSLFFLHKYHMAACHFEGVPPVRDDEKSFLTQKRGLA